MYHVYFCFTVVRKNVEHTAIKENISQADFKELISGISVFVEKKLRKEFCKFSRTCRYVAIFCESTLAIHSDPCYFSFPVQRFYP